MIERDRANATRARDLRQFVCALIDDLAAAASTPKRWSEHARWAKRKLTDLLSLPDRRGRWPDGESKAGDRLERALDRMVALDAIEPPVPLDVFTPTLALELDADIGRAGRVGEARPGRDGEDGPRVDFDVVVVRGLAEGFVPSLFCGLAADGDRGFVAG